MKKINKLIALLIVCMAMPALAGAQVLKNAYFNVDWQMNAPLNTNFADKISGWGMNLEGGYFLTPHWSLGAFLDFHTNHKICSASNHN